MKNFENKVVAVTGCATGVSVSFAKQFAQEGATVVMAGRHEQSLLSAVAKLSEQAVAARYFVCDGSRRADIDDFADFAWEAFGQVDVAVNCAETTVPHRNIIDTPEDEVLRIFVENVVGVWNACAVFGRRFIEQRTRAAIYNVGSERSLFNDAAMGAACTAADHAVLAMTESLREELPELIDVGLLCPGFVSSGLDDSASGLHAIDVDEFARSAMTQIKSNEFYVVPYAYDPERLNARHDAITRAYAKYAMPY